VFGLVLGEAMCHYVSSVESMPAIYWLAFNTLRHTHIDVPVGRFALRKVMRYEAHILLGYVSCPATRHDTDTYDYIESCHFLKFYRYGRVHAVSASESMLHR
jgi:hypothetical protein